MISSKACGAIRRPCRCLGFTLARCESWRCVARGVVKRGRRAGIKSEKLENKFSPSPRRCGGRRREWIWGLGLGVCLQRLARRVVLCEPVAIAIQSEASKRIR